MQEVDDDIRLALDEGDADTAVTLVLQQYGPQLLGYLTALSTPVKAREIYSLLAEDLWRGLPKFEWRCTLRAWAYTLARNARARHLDSEKRRDAQQEVTPPEWLQKLALRTRSPTPLHRKSEVKDAMRVLRQKLSEHEQTLLMLRVDRGLAWQELVVILDEQRADESIASAATRLRQRFQSLKDKLRDLARAEGLIADGSS
jgi:RNA polymerase sigma-70 factor (ECF subfamily)